MNCFSKDAIKYRSASFTISNPELEMCTHGKVKILALLGSPWTSVSRKTVFSQWQPALKLRVVGSYPLLTTSNKVKLAFIDFFTIFSSSIQFMVPDLIYIH